MNIFSSLRVKLFLWISALIFTFVLFSLLMNTQFLKPYYMSIQKKQHIEISNNLSDLYLKETSEFLLEIERLERMGGYRVIIIDRDNLIIFDSIMDGGQYDLRLPPPHQRNTHNDNNPFIPGAITVNSFKESEHIYKVNHDHRLNINYLDTYTLFEEERILLLSGQIDTMNNSIDIATKFFMFTGIITVIIGSIAAFMFSRKFTKPITELKAISVSMSHLDFQS